MGYLAVKEGCPRCGGKGFIPEYKHIDNGICFRCRNMSAEDVNLSNFHELATKQEQRRLAYPCYRAATMEEVNARQKNSD